MEQPRLSAGTSSANGYALGAHAEASDPSRSGSAMSHSPTLTPSRGGTLKKKSSVKRPGSLHRNHSRRSLVGSVKSLVPGDPDKYHGNDLYSAFYTPVPTKSNPTEILADRFQEWRKVLKDILAYFRETHKSHESQAKSLHSLSNLISNTTMPHVFLSQGGIGDSTDILRQYHKQALAECGRAKGIEEDIIVQLTGLRADLAHKIKEIKNLSGDFKNAVDKEVEGTRKAVRNLQEAIAICETDPSASTGKGDPFLVKLAVERQVERQIDEENYLHQAFLNLENSGRELESIVVGEIQKAYNAYAGILRREADDAYEAAEALRGGPVVMPKDLEWEAFVENNEHFVDPKLPVRKPDQIHYPGKDNPVAAEIRAGMLERKSKYLKSYTPGWYILSPTHLHEFKSQDHINSQAPVMSLFLQEQKLGSHSSVDSSSHKFMLKGRQTGAMHRGHGWVFRAESRDTMLAWYEDIRSLTEKTGEERSAFVRKHARSVSNGTYPSGPGSISSDGALEEDEADQVPYSAQASLDEIAPQGHSAQRPQPGGRFPSDINLDRHLQIPFSPSSGNSSDERETLTIAGAHPSSPTTYRRSEDQVRLHEDQKAVVVMSGGFAGAGDSGRRPATNAQHMKQSQDPATEHAKVSTQNQIQGAQAQEWPWNGTGADTTTTALQKSQAASALAGPKDRLNEHTSAATGSAMIGVTVSKAYRDYKQDESQQEEVRGIYQPVTELDRSSSYQEASTVSLSRSNSSNSSTTTPLAMQSNTTPSEMAPARAPGAAVRLDMAGDRPLMSGMGRAKPATPERHASLDTIGTVSDLHVPGEYPRGQRL